MNKNQCTTIIMCVVFFLCLIDALAHADIKATIKSASEYDYPPFCTVSKDGKADGFSVELLSAALQRVDLDVEFEVGPWAEVKEKLKDGKVVFPPGFTDAVNELIRGGFVHTGRASLMSVGLLLSMDIGVSTTDCTHSIIQQRSSGLLDAAPRFTKVFPSLRRSPISRRIGNACSYNSIAWRASPKA